MSPYVAGAGRADKTRSAEGGYQATRRRALVRGKGACYAAGLAVGFWKSTDEMRDNWNESQRWQPEWNDEQRTEGYARWKKAVERTLDWVDVG